MQWNPLSRPGLFKLGIIVAVLFVFILFVRLQPQFPSTSEIVDDEKKNIEPLEELDYDGVLTGDDPCLTPYGKISTVQELCPINNVSKCLKFLRETRPKKRLNDNETLILHTAWRGGIVPVHQFLLYSFLATQNLSRTILVYWIDQSTFQASLDSPLLAPFLNHPNIIFKCYNVNKLATGTPLDLEVEHGEDTDHIEKLLKELRGPAAGDLFRMLILYRYGGIYVDVDVILLRSLEPLMANEFGYTWSGFDKLNTAVFSLKARGELIEQLFDFIISERRPDFHPFELFAGVRNRTLPLVIYPSHFFDPVWAIFDGISPLEDGPYSKFKGLFEPAKPNTNFWRGAYANHFHNMYAQKNWTTDSWAGIMEREWKAKLLKLPKQNEIRFWKKENDELLISKCK
jgi:hypothetical protein